MSGCSSQASIAGGDRDGSPVLADCVGDPSRLTSVTCRGMATSGTASQSTAETPRWTLIGPGLVVAATGVGAIDLVATLIAGS